MTTHIGRSWPGMGNPLERECPCPKEPCGLVDRDKISPDCAEHPMRLAKTIRQSHPADECPGARTLTGRGSPPDMVVGVDGGLYTMDLHGDIGSRVTSFGFGGLDFTLDCFPGVKSGDVLRIRSTEDGWEVVRIRWPWWRWRPVRRVLVSGRHL